jgi:transposase
MRGRRLIIDWHEDEATLGRLYREEAAPDLRTRFHALWLLRQGHSGTAVARLVGVHVRTVRQWVAWYRLGGVAAVRQHRNGGRQGRTPYLTADQRAQLVAHAAAEPFPSIGAAQHWVERAFGVHYTYWGMRSLFRQLELTPKVPRPLAEKASLEAQEAWKRGGLPTPSAPRG